MLQVLELVLPLFAIIAMGKAAISFGYIDAADAATLSRFTFYVPIPALLFGLMAEADVSFGMSLVYFAAALVLTAALPTGANAFLIARGATTCGESSATTVVMATVCSIVTLPLILYWLR